MEIISELYQSFLELSELEQLLFILLPFVGVILHIMAGAKRKRKSREVARREQRTIPRKPSPESPHRERYDYAETVRPLILAKHGGNEQAAEPVYHQLVEELFATEIASLREEAKELHDFVLSTWNPGRCEECGSNNWKVISVNRDKFRLVVNLLCESQHAVALKTDPDFPPHLEVPLLSRLDCYLWPETPILPPGASLSLNVKGGEHYRRSNKKGRAHLPSSVQRTVFERDGGRCVLCGSQDDLQFDHIIPHSKGGGDQQENLRLLCRDCNLKKGADF